MNRQAIDPVSGYGFDRIAAYAASAKQLPKHLRVQPRLTDELAQ